MLLYVVIFSLNMDMVPFKVFIFFSEKFFFNSEFAFLSVCFLWLYLLKKIKKQQFMLMRCHEKYKGSTDTSLCSPAVYSLLYQGMRSPDVLLLEASLLTLMHWTCIYHG